MCLTSSSGSSGCRCLYSPRCGGLGQKDKTKVQTALSLRQLTIVDGRVIEGVMMAPMEEVNHIEGKSELAMIEITELLEECDNIFNFNCCAGTLVMESGPATAENVTADCNEGELVHNMNEKGASMTVPYLHSSSTSGDQIVSAEETNRESPNKDASQKRSTSLQNADPTLNELPSRDNIMPFASDDDGTSHNESTFGILPGDRRNFNYSNYSFKSRIVGNSALTDAYCESDRPHKSQGHQLILPYPGAIDGHVKEPVAGI